MSTPPSTMTDDELNDRIYTNVARSTTYCPVKQAETDALQPSGRLEIPDLAERIAILRSRPLIKRYTTAEDRRILENVLGIRSRKYGEEAEEEEEENGGQEAEGTGGESAQEEEGAELEADTAGEDDAVRERAVQTDESADGGENDAEEERLGGGGGGPKKNALKDDDGDGEGEGGEMEIDTEGRDVGRSRAGPRMQTHAGAKRPNLETSASGSTYPTKRQKTVVNVTEQEDEDDDDRSMTL